MLHRRVRKIVARIVFGAIVVFAANAAAGSIPLDLLDPTPRDVLVQVENSLDLAVVGQSFGDAFPATYSASGNIGTLVISAETHELMNEGFLAPPVAGSFTPIVIEFDLNTFEAMSQPASGAFSGGPISSSFTQQSLDTLGVAGFVGPGFAPLFCTSQQEVDDACLIAPVFCGLVCTIVPGLPYDPMTGLVNLVGRQTEAGCDGAVCSGPFDMFARNGDLLLSESDAANESGGGGGSNTCFIATAAFGTPLAHQLDGLRAFRDEKLLDNPAGATFADAYYRLSPPLADRIARHDVLRTLIRRLLAPIARATETPATENE